MLILPFVLPKLSSFSAMEAIAPIPKVYRDASDARMIAK